MKANQETAKRLQTIEKDSEGLFNKATSYSLIVTILFIAAIGCIVYGFSEQSMGWIFFGVGCLFSALIYGTGIICKLLANLLKVQLLKCHTDLDIPVEKKESPKDSQPDVPQGTYVGGIKLEDY